MPLLASWPQLLTPAHSDEHALVAAGGPMGKTTVIGVVLIHPAPDDSSRHIGAGRRPTAAAQLGGQGAAPDPDVTLRTTWADWIDVSVRGQDARKAMLTRKVRPRAGGKPRASAREASRRSGNLAYHESGKR